MRYRNLLLYLLIAAIVIIFDQFTKFLIQSSFYEGETVSVIGDLLYFRLVYNTGGAMGTSIGPSWIYLVLTIIALVIIIRYLVKGPDVAWHVKAALAMIFGGAVGNMIDRVLYGKVIDFIDMDFPDIPFLHIYRWFTYNVADTAITIGLVIFIASILFKKENKPDLPEKEETPDLLKDDLDRSYS